MSTKLTYPDGVKFVNYVYDSNSRLTTVTDWANRQTIFTYDLAGRMTGISRPNGTVRSITYDAAGQTTQITEVTSAGIPISYFKLGHDEAGRINDEFIAPIPAAFTEATETITYDADNRIAAFNAHAVVHDADGNMTSGPLNSSTAVSHTYDARNRLTAVAASGSAPALTYGYDSEGNRTSIAQAGQTTSYVFNPAAKLPQALVRTKPDLSKTYYVYGLGLLYQVDDAGNTVTYHHDYRGSTVALTGLAGQVTDRMEYNTYGLITLRTGTTDTPFLYNGRYGVMTDANGLCYMRARYYNPYIKRFINADPAGFAGALNFYSAFDGNPISRVDPFGLWAGVDDAIATGGGALIGSAAQGIGDLIHGQASSWQHYVAAAVGGAAAGEATLYTGPAGGVIARAAVGGAVGGFIGNTTRQTLDLAPGDQTSYSVSSAVTETTLGGVFGAGGGYVGSKVIPAALSYLPASTKGSIGEGLSLLDNMMQGRVPVGSQVEVALPETFTRVDWQFRNVADWSLVNVEAKFGTAGLTPAQRLANQVLPNYEVDRFTYSWISRSGTGLGASLGYGAASQSSRTGK